MNSAGDSTVFFASPSAAADGQGSAARIRGVDESDAGGTAGSIRNGFWITSGGGASLTTGPTSAAYPATHEQATSHVTTPVRSLNCSVWQRGLVIDQSAEVDPEIRAAGAHRQHSTPGNRQRPFRIRLRIGRLTSKIAPSGHLFARPAGTGVTDGPAAGGRAAQSLHPARLKRRGGEGARRWAPGASWP